MFLDNESYRLSGGQGSLPPSPSAQRSKEGSFVQKLFTQLKNSSPKQIRKSFEKIQSTNFSINPVPVATTQNLMTYSCVNRVFITFQELLKEKPILHEIFAWALKQKNNELLQKKYHYPVRFEGKILEKQIKFYLIIFKNNDIFLGFKNQNKTDNLLQEYLGANWTNLTETLSYQVSPNEPSNQEKKAVENLKKIYLVLQNHPCTSEIFSSEMMGNQFCLLQKIYEKNLFEMASELLSANTRQLFFYTRDLFCALAHIHGLNIIHRCVIPENLYIKDERLILTNFTHACFESDKTIFSGSPQNVSPEAKDNYLGYSCKSDVWSAACVLWFIWNGESLPWAELEDFNEEKRQFFCQSFKSYSKNEIQLEAMHFLLWNMFEPDPNVRWSAKECLDYLDNHKNCFI